MAHQRVHVERELHIAAPEGHAVYVHSPCYASASGTALLEAVRHEAMQVRPDGSRCFYAKRIYRRRSEDNGRTWTEEENEHRGRPEGATGPRRYPGALVLDERNDILICLFCTYEVDPDEPFLAIGCRAQRTRRMFHQLSRDGGRTWTEPRQVVDARSQYDPTNWAPGISYGTTGGIASGQHVFLPDGTLVIGFVASHPQAPPGNATPRVREHYASTIYAQACTDAGGSALQWRFGDSITVEYPKSADGCCEPALARLGGNRLFNTMRCQGDQASGIYSTRYATVSEDGGLTWSEPRPLVYDDGGIVWTPASVHQFFRSSRTGKTYLLANVLPGPVHDQTPRYPLTIAEFDTERLCVLRDSVQVIQDLPEGAPKERRYTNWGMYEERGTRDLILIMPEQPKHTDFSAMTKPEDFTADCIRFRIRLGG